jgi:ATP-dependent DNA helicase RecG
VQGDVGSGKTVVALFAALRAIDNGYQAALMAPTEILAEQHARSIRDLLRDLPVNVTLLTGSLSAPEKRRRTAAVASGEAQLVIGTHALIQEGVEFKRLGLAIVDEQHRFGVRQRLALTARGESGGKDGRVFADVLVMSATPIPRSLALTLYGDLDLSVLDELPPGRTPVRTVLRRSGHRGRVFDFVRQQVDVGRQAFVVYPLVEGSETLDLRAATEEYATLGEEMFAGLRLALLHGQLPSEEKDRVMRAFAAGDIDVLVATSIVEVGIDVPNATVMVIEHAERFGLSQLHQLRGRVGRGTGESFCILISDPADAIERLGLFCNTQDGFRIAEEDLRLRGQGDLFGARQSGIAEFRNAKLESDLDLLTVARTHARRLIEADPTLSTKPELRDALEKRFGERAELFRVG